MMKSSVTTLAIALAAVLLLVPKVCLSFQPKISPLTTTLTSSSSSSSSLFSRDRRNTNTPLLPNDDNDEKSLIDKITHQAATFATASAIFFSFGTMLMTPTSPAFAADTASDGAPQQSLLLQGASSADELIQQQRETSVVEEVWNLIDKYYIDRSFNKLDWNTVRSDVLAKAEKSNFDNDMIGTQEY
jgi:hypothetical protein